MKANKNTTIETPAIVIPTVQAVNPLDEMGKQIAKLESENVHYKQENERMKRALSILDGNDIKNRVAAYRGHIEKVYNLTLPDVNFDKFDKNLTTVTPVLNGSDVSKIPLHIRKSWRYASNVKKDLENLRAKMAKWSENVAPIK